MPGLHQPVEQLEEEECGEERDEAHVELLAEDGHGEAGLGDGVPRALVQVLHLRLAQSAEEEALDQLPREEREHERLVAEREEAELVGGEVDHRGVELPPRLVRLVRDGRHERGRGQCVHAEAHGGARSPQTAQPQTRAVRYLRNIDAGCTVRCLHSFVCRVRRWSFAWT